MLVPLVGARAAHPPVSRKRQAHGHARADAGAVRGLLCARPVPALWEAGPVGRRHLVLGTASEGDGVLRCPVLASPCSVCLLLPRKDPVSGLWAQPKPRMASSRILQPAETPFPSVVESQVGVNLVRTQPVAGPYP